MFDPYRAGYALGESLASLAPEVVFLNSSINYAVAELLEGLYDGLDSEQVVVIGLSGHGQLDLPAYAEFLDGKF